MQCLNKSDVESSKIPTVWNIKLIMVYYWTYFNSLTSLYGTRLKNESFVSSFNLFFFFFFQMWNENTGIFVL